MPLSDSQFITILISIMSTGIAIIGALGGGIYWITRKITKLEDRIDAIEDNPLLQVFKETQNDFARALVSADNIIKGYEAKKVSSKKEKEEEKK